MDDYFSMEKDIYIVNDKQDANIFLLKDYQENVLAEFKVKEGQQDIKFSIKQFCKNINLIKQGIKLFNEILYFKGNKRKNVIFVKDNKKCYIKKVSDFEAERINKFESIDELYKYPHLVPWNLVPREWDVMKIVKENISLNDNILEIGSGYGKNLLLLKELGYQCVKGIEYSKNAYDLSTKFKYNLEHNCNESILCSPYKEKYFDAIIDIGCLHCIDSSDKTEALNEIKRILKSGGILISRYFLPKNEEWIRKYPIKIKNFGNTENELKKYLEKDFCIKKIYTENECIYIIASLK